MSFVKLSDKASADLERLFRFLMQFDAFVAKRAIDTVIDGIEILKVDPYRGSPLSDRPNVKKLVIEFGASGYLVFHKRYENQDTNFVMRILHQKEWYDEASIGLSEDVAEFNAGENL